MVSRKCRVTKRLETGLGSLLNFAAPNAGGANPDPLGCTLDERTHGLQIQIPAAFTYVVCVTDSIAELGAASADFTYFRHDDI